MLFSSLLEFKILILILHQNKRLLSICFESFIKEKFERKMVRIFLILQINFSEFCALFLFIVLFHFSDNFDYFKDFQDGLFDINLPVDNCSLKSCHEFHRISFILEENGLERQLISEKVDSQSNLKTRKINVTIAYFERNFQNSIQNPTSL